jgi:predicted metal-dependent RNase
MAAPRFSGGMWYMKKIKLLTGSLKKNWSFSKIETVLLGSTYGNDNSPGIDSTDDAKGRWPVTAYGSSGC